MEKCDFSSLKFENFKIPFKTPEKRKSKDFFLFIEKQTNNNDARYNLKDKFFVFGVDSNYSLTRFSRTLLEPEKNNTEEKDLVHI